MPPPARPRAPGRTVAAWFAALTLCACAPVALDGAARPPYRAVMDASDRTHWTVDRLEDEGRVVLETDAGATLDLPAAWLPDAIREGDVLRVEVRRDEEEAPYARAVRFVRDEAETERRRRAAVRLRESLPSGPEGDLDL